MFEKLLIVDSLTIILYILSVFYKELKMISVHGIYENGKIKLLEPILFKKNAKVIITILDDINTEEKAVPLDYFDDLTGAISLRTDGSDKHDDYIYTMDNL